MQEKKRSFIPGRSDRIPGFPPREDTQPKALSLVQRLKAQRRQGLIPHADATEDVPRLTEKQLQAAHDVSKEEFTPIVAEVHEPSLLSVGRKRRGEKRLDEYRERCDRKKKTA